PVTTAGKYRSRDAIAIAEPYTKGGGNNVDGYPLPRRRPFRSPFRLVSLFVVPRQRRAFHFVDDSTFQMDYFRRRRPNLLSVLFQEKCESVKIKYSEINPFSQRQTAIKNEEEMT
ncbi:MAG: hypothetical protein IKW79_04265, partial [Schwartzia sp.]|nr:hypothetical protein [Schwartzia sp. (in: firmicutes)]